MKNIITKFFKCIVNTLFKISFDKPLQPPSRAEKIIIAELLSEIRELQAVETTNVLSSEKEWTNNMNRLKELILNRDPREFLRWDVINQTMFVSSSPFISLELKYLRMQSDWKSRWRPSIKETSIGHPYPYIFYPTSSGNLIHHAYHLVQFEKKSKLKIDNMNFVFEFGGGYGSMCRLFYNLGFKGKYIIFDLPLFSVLQRYYLKSLGLPLQSIKNFKDSSEGIVCVSDIEVLTSLLKNYVNLRNYMFIATWSLSESPIEIRYRILELISEFHAFLITYQKQFAEVNNIHFFDYWKEQLRKVNWQCWDIEHLPGNKYLVGF